MGHPTGPTHPLSALDTLPVDNLLHEIKKRVVLGSLPLAYAKAELAKLAHTPAATFREEPEPLATPKSLRNWSNPGPVHTSQGDYEWESVVELPLEALELPGRPRNHLLRRAFLTVGDLLWLNPREAISLPGIGVASLQEITAYLARLGLRLAQDSDLLPSGNRWLLVTPPHSSWSMWVHSGQLERVRIPWLLDEYFWSDRRPERRSIGDLRASGSEEEFWVDLIESARRHRQNLDSLRRHLAPFTRPEYWEPSAYTERLRRIK